MTNQPLQPTSQNQRIPSLDFLRGIAILGILFINIENFAYPDSWSPYKFGFAEPIDHSTRFWVYFLTQGKFYTMFALLFGVGFYMFLERLENRGLGLKAMDIYARRLLWLFVIGVIHSIFIWDGDILYHYAICGFLLFPFRSMRSRYLLLVVALFVTVRIANSYEHTNKKILQNNEYVMASNIPEKERSASDAAKINSWESKLELNTSDTSYYEPHKKTYWQGLQESYDHSEVPKGVVYYKSLMFSTLIVMIIGIMLYRSGIFSDYKVWKHYWLINGLILIVALAINYFRYYHWTYKYNEPVINIWQGWAFTYPREILGVAYVLILNGLFQKFLNAKRVKAISNVGKMALSNYIFQNIILGIIFYGYGLSLFNQYSRFELLGFVLVIWFIQIILSWFWLMKYKQGPLEWAWRRLTYRSFE